MREIKLKKNRFDSMIHKIKFIIFKIKVRNNGIQIWNKNVEDLMDFYNRKMNSSQRANNFRQPSFDKICGSI
jgi:hypothetical protein